jgi:aldehyde dehydrogenase (NAD+)
MQHEKQFYIDGTWVDPVTPALLHVIEPSTEEACTQIAVGSAADVDRTAAAAVRPSTCGPPCSPALPTT